MKGASLFGMTDTENTAVTVETTVETTVENNWQVESLLDGRWVRVAAPVYATEAAASAAIEEARALGDEWTYRVTQVTQI